MIKLCRKYYKFLRIIKRSQSLYILLSFSYKGRRCHSKTRCGFSDAAISLICLLHILKFYSLKFCLQINVRISVPFTLLFSPRSTGMLSGPIRSSLLMITVLSTRFFNSLMFPGQRYSFKSSSASKEKDFLKPYFLFSFPREQQCQGPDSL